MIFKIILTFLIFTISLSLWALPQSFEIWFLSKQEVALLNQLLEQHYYSYKMSEDNFAQGDYYPDARPMGDGYYFHPQVGLFKREDGKQEESENVKKEVPNDVQERAERKFFSATDTSMINCDKSSPFDLFCGKAKKIPQKDISLEVWIDTSSSLRAVDYSDKQGYCGRRNFVERLLDHCGDEKVEISVFDVFKRSISITNDKNNLNVLCEYQGLNDQDRLIKWIEQTDVKKLIIITDIAEYTSKLSNFVDSNGGKFVGDSKSMSVKDLLNMVSNVTKFCK